MQSCRHRSDAASGFIKTLLGVYKTPDLRWHPLMSHHNDHLARYGKVKKLYCGRRHNMPPPRPPSWQYLCFYSPAGTCSGMLAIKTSATSWPFDLESGVRVTCNVGYLCANFSLPSISVLDLGPMYATDVKQHHRFMPPPGRGITNTSKWCTLTMFTYA